MTVSTSQYQAAHARKPRGTGWWFFLASAGGFQFEFTHVGTYTEAKKAAIKWARSINASSLEVGS